MKKNNASELAAALSSAKGTLEGDLKAASERRRDVETAADEARALVASVKGHITEIEQSKANAAGYQKLALDAQTSAEQAASASAAIQTRLVTMQLEANTAATAVAEILRVSTQSGQDTSGFLAAAKADKDSLTKLLDELERKDEIANGYEDRITNLTDQAEQLRLQIEKLVSSATSAGLAVAFDKQKQRFGIPQTYWLKTFIVCISVLFFISVPSFLHAVFPGLLTMQKKVWAWLSSD